MPSGRRPGPSVTRDKIVAAARRQFASNGYERATLRAIASGAHVDQRLITHFFGSKRGVFVAAMVLPIDPAAFVASVAAPGIRGFGERLAWRWVGLWDSEEGRHLVGLLRSAVSNGHAAKMMRGVFVHVVLRQLVRALDIDHPDRRASLVASQLFGLVVVRYVLRLPAVTAMSPDEVSRWIGPTIQRYLESDAPVRRRRDRAVRQRRAR